MKHYNEEQPEGRSHQGSRKRRAKLSAGQDAQLYGRRDTWRYPRRIVTLALLGVLCFSVGSLRADDADEESSPNFWFGVGPAIRGGMRIHTRGTSYVQMLGLHNPSAAAPLSPPSGIGATNSYGDRLYDNGYVKLDPGTGNPSAANPSGTWNWGFSDPSQYNANAHTLTFQKQGAAGFNSQERDPSGSDAFLGAGVQVEAGVRLRETPSWSLDLCLGFQGIWNAKEKFSTSTYSDQVQQITVTDAYDVSGIPAGSFPANGFHGTFLGPFDTPPVVPSPQIPNIPASRSSAFSAATSSSYNQINFDVNQSLYQFSLGPQVTILEHEGVKVHVRPTVSANIVDVSAHRTEVYVQTPAGGGSTVLDRWSDQGSHLGVSVGLGAVGGLDFDLGHGFFTGAFGGYEWVAEKVNVPVGPNVLSADASGWVAGGVIGVRF